MADIIKQPDHTIATYFVDVGTYHFVDRETRLTNSWPLVKLEFALATCFAYIGIIAIMYAIQICIHGEEEPKRVKFNNVWEKIQKDGVIVLLQLSYNITQVALCVWMVYEALRLTQANSMAPLCNIVSVNDRSMAYLIWVFYLSKVLDFFDTIFIVARRKWTQLSFLHLYHHTTIFLVYWLNVNFNYFGDVYLTVVLNGTIHAIMYFYYFVTALNISVPQALKKMITLAQMAQFVIMISQAVYMLYNGCPSPKNVTILYLVYIISMFVLFNNFRKRAYSKKTKDKKA